MITRTSLKFTSSGIPRTANLRYPSTRPPRAGWPLIVALHGASGWAEQFEQQTQLTARAVGYALLYGQGVGNTWNNGMSHGSTADDVRYFDDALLATSRATHIDATRINVVGFSAGGIQTWRLIAERSQVIAAAGIVAGDVPNLTAMPAVPVDVHLTWGTEDEYVRFGGGPGVGDPTAIHHSFDESVKWNAGTGGFTEMHVVKGGGHQIPGANAIHLPDTGVCMKTPDTVAGWLGFFEKRSRK